jgi:hypothetical protein
VFILILFQKRTVPFDIFGATTTSSFHLLSLSLSFSLSPAFQEEKRFSICGPCLISLATVYREREKPK